ncbi:MAG: PD40 domain-containing protein [Saprospiraceae bacterium]|nr:PD40 domain-containing protein [Saprospiraceae bacterium]
MRKPILLFIAVALLAIGSTAAQNSKIRRAEEAMRLLQYAEAIKLYQEVIAKSPDQKVQTSLAVAYRKNLDYANAAAAFRQITDWENVSPDCLLQYGRVLLQTESCTAAQPVFDSFIERSPSDGRVPHLRDICSYLASAQNKNDGQIEVFQAGFNSPLADMSPVLFGNDLVFASNRNAGAGGFMDLFVVPQPSQAVDAAPFATELNTKLHEAAAVFSRDLSRIFYTRSRESATVYTDSRIVPLEIMTSTRQNDGKWSKPEPLNLCPPEFAAAHPALSPDEKRLYFSSDLPGGFGGKDLYYSDWNGSAWGTPVNLGPDINTESDELFPFIAPDNRLYFASDGHPGLGSLDLFSVAAGGAQGEWGAVENLGAPFNSPEDDFAFSLAPDGLSGYFSSNRPGGAGGDDVYGFRYAYRTLNFSIQDAATGNPLENAAVESACNRTDGKPGLRFPVNDCCTVTASAPGYDSQTLKICDTETGLDFSTPYPIRLAAEKIYELTGRVLDEDKGAPLSGAAIHIFDASGALAQALVSDQNGQFATTLPKGKCYKFKVEKGDYFAQTLDEQICAEGAVTLFRLEILLQPFWISASNTQRPLHAPVKGVFASGTATAGDKTVPYLLQIYYDRYSSDIREDALPEMTRLQKLLEDNPGIVLEISSHTDTRGDKGFNQKLSQKRADIVVRWLIERGIESKRLIAKGYGKSRPVNRCVDGVTCPEAEHQLNRRTEFRVIGTVK